MALGETQLSNMALDRMDIDNCIKTLKNSWNTFQYVTNQLQYWADETKVGAAARLGLGQLNRNLESLLDNTQKLSKVLNDFEDRQRKTNQGL